MKIPKKNTEKNKTGTAVIKLVSNMVGTARIEKLESRDFYVCPVVMGVVGVWNGSQGPVLYTAEQLGAWPQGWDHKPIVVYHPVMNSKSLSACDPEIINAQKVGILLNTTFDGYKLKSEAWIDKERVGSVDKRVEDAIVANQMMEVSTGLFAGLEMEAGDFDGVVYNGTAVNLRPDHLALLPDEEGACSLTQGAGLMRNARNKKDVDEIIKLHNEISHNQTHDQLVMSVKDTYGETNIWIVDVYDDYFVYEQRDMVFSHNYTKDGDNVALVGSPERVERQITYKKVTAQVNNKADDNLAKGERDMKLIDQIIANTQFTESDRETLEAMDEETLKKMLPVQNQESDKPKTESEEKEAGKPAGEELSVQNKKMTATDILAHPDVDPELKSFISNGIRKEREQKEEMIQAILNAEAGFERKELEDKTVDFLQKVSDGIKRAESTTPIRNNYAGNAPVQNVATGVKCPQLPGMSDED